MPGIGPGVVEHVLALGMAFHVHGHHAEQRLAFFQDQMKGLPAGAGRGAAALLKSVQEFVAHEGIERDLRMIRIGTGVPAVAGHFLDAVEDSGGALSQFR